MKKLFITTICLLFLFPAMLFAGFENKSFNFDGNNREYRVFIPNSFSPSNSYSLVIGIHGLGDNMTAFSNAFGEFHDIADTANIIFAYPQGMSNPIGNGWNAGAGMLGVYPSVGINDVGFINALVDTMQANYPIVVAQTYLFGFSNGGFMVQRIACEDNGRFAAIASLAGTLGNQITTCNPARKLPILHFHGTADINVGYNSTPFGINVDSLMHLWAINNSCDAVPNMIPVPDTKADGFTVEHYQYSGCTNRLELFKIYDAAHILLRKSDNDIGYSEEMWKFFRPHTLTSGVNETARNFRVEIYPVPAKDIVNIQLQNIVNHQNLQVSIYDFTGKQIAQLPGNNSGSYSFDCSNLSNGVYLIKATNGSNSYNSKFTVTR